MWSNSKQSQLFLNRYNHLLLCKSIIKIKYSFHLIFIYFLISLMRVIYIYTIGDSFLNITISILFQTTITLIYLMILNGIKKLNQINYKRWKNS